MTSRIFISKRELEIINDIVRENEIQNSFELISNNNSGIGSTLEIEFDHELHGRYVTVRVNITDSDSW
jgi:hypothetical protein